ncbi:MAG: vitamin-B12 independent methionine synthase [Actinomycetota bacterium]
MGPYPVSVVGSWPRPAWLLKAVKSRDPDLAELQDQATLLAIKHQEDAGVDVVSDGEQRRDNFYSCISDGVEGVESKSLAELLDYVEDKSAFEGLLNALDVPSFAIRNPTVVGKLTQVRPLVLDDYRFLRAHTRLPVKVTLPGPYLLSRSMWVKALSAGAYPTRESLADDIVAILREEILELARQGAEVIQLDEPVLTELMFAGKSATRTFMCAALAANADPVQELELAVELVNRVFAGVTGTVRALHVCRGNWSQDESVLLAGPYDSLIPYLSRMEVDQFVLEYATERAGPLEVLKDLPLDRQLAIGVVNPRTEQIESPTDVADRVRMAAQFLGGDRIWLNPDCGFGTFAERPVATTATAVGKLHALTEAAALLRAAPG